jgi:hypothetical protein
MGGTSLGGGGGMKTVLGIGSSFSLSASTCGTSSACSERAQAKDNARITEGVIDAFDTLLTYRLQCGRGVVVFILLANVKEHAPPPLESESAATEGLHGGCRVSSCVCPALARCKWGSSPLWKYQNMKMNKPPSEANSGAGDRSGEGRLGENRELMDKNRLGDLLDDGQPNSSFNS